MFTNRSLQVTKKNSGPFRVKHLIKGSIPLYNSSCSNHNGYISIIIRLCLVQQKKYFIWLLSPHSQIVWVDFMSHGRSKRKRVQCWLYILGRHSKNPHKKNFLKTSLYSSWNTLGSAITIVAHSSLNAACNSTTSCCNHLHLE